MVPEKWNELSRKQLLVVMRVLYGNTEFNEAQLKLFRELCGIGWFRFWRTSLLWFEERLYMIEWLIKETTLTRQLIPKYWGFHGPSSDFDNLTGAEFAFAESYYLRYRDHDGDIDSLNHLVATLYRPRKKNYDCKLNPDGDTRETFNPNLLDRYANLVHHWPMTVKLAVMTWYEGCRANLTRLYPKVFSGRGETAQFGFWSVMRGIAEKGTHGSFEQVEKMPVKIMMMELTELINEGERLEKIYAKK